MIQAIVHICQKAWRGCSIQVKWWMIIPGSAPCHRRAIFKLLNFLHCEVSISDENKVDSVAARFTNEGSHCPAKLRLVSEINLISSNVGNLIIDRTLFIEIISEFWITFSVIFYNFASHQCLRNIEIPCTYEHGMIFSEYDENGWRVKIRRCELDIFSDTFNQGC